MQLEKRLTHMKGMWCSHCGNEIMEGIEVVQIKTDLYGNSENFIFLKEHLMEWLNNAEDKEVIHFHYKKQDNITINFDDKNPDFTGKDPTEHWH